VEDDLGLLTAVANKDLLEAADFGSRRFLKRLRRSDAFHTLRRMNFVGPI